MAIFKEKEKFEVRLINQNLEVQGRVYALM